MFLHEKSWPETMMEVKEINSPPSSTMSQREDGLSKLGTFQNFRIKSLVYFNDFQRTRRAPLFVIHFSFLQIALLKELLQFFEILKFSSSVTHYLKMNMSSSNNLSWFLVSLHSMPSNATANFHEMHLVQNLFITK